MKRKDWLLVVVPKDELEKVAGHLKHLHQETYYGRIVKDIVVLFLTNKPEQLKQIYLDLNSLKALEDLSVVFVNDFGLIS